MKKIDIDVLKEAAANLMFDMTEDQYQTLLEEFAVLGKQMEIVSQIEGLENYEPMTFPFDCSSSYLREDIAETPLSVDEALSNASSKKDNQIKLPKVVS